MKSNNLCTIKSKLQVIPRANDGTFDNFDYTLDYDKGEMISRVHYNSYVYCTGIK